MDDLSDQTYAALYDLAEAFIEHPRDLLKVCLKHYDVFLLLNAINGGKDFRTGPDGSLR